MREPRDLLAGDRDALDGLRRSAGPAGALFAPLQLTADLLDQTLGRQQELEAQLSGALKQLEALYALAGDAPAALRTQATAFSAAAVSFEHAAQMMNAQADLLERAASALNAPARILRP